MIELTLDGQAHAIVTSALNKAALHAAGWTLKRSAQNGVPSIVAEKAGQTLAISVFTGGTDQWKPYTPQLKGTMVFATFHR